MKIITAIVAFLKSIPIIARLIEDWKRNRAEKERLQREQEAFLRRNDKRVAVDEWMRDELPAATDAESQRKTDESSGS